MSEIILTLTDFKGITPELEKRRIKTWKFYRTLVKALKKRDITRQIYRVSLKNRFYKRFKIGDWYISQVAIDVEKEQGFWDVNEVINSKGVFRPIMRIFF